MFAKALKKAIKLNDTTQLKVAEELGMRKQSLNQMFANNNMREESIFKILECLNCEVVVRSKDPENPYEIVVKPEP